MSNSQKVKAMVALWLIVILGSFALRFGMVIEGAGFARGMERGIWFILGLFLSVLIALQTRLYALTLPKGEKVRLLGYLPLGATIALLCFGAVMLLRAVMQTSEALE